MTPKTGQSVKLFLRYGIEVEGLVKEWTEEQIVLQTENGYSTIYNPSEDLIMTQIVGKPNVIVIETPNEPEQPIKSSVIDNLPPQPHIDEVPEEATPEQKKVELEREFLDVKENMPSANSLRLEKLAKLRLMLKEADAQIIRKELRNPVIGGKQTAYGEQVAIFRRAK